LALRKITIDYINEMIKLAGFKMKGLKMCELGNQLISDNCVNFETAKEYFESLGVIHTSIDWNGKNGALALDLNKPIDIGEFDVITNVGFIEHVEDEEQCLENVHNLTRDGGAIIHIAPKVGSYVKHKCYRWYVEEWFYELAERKKYKILDVGIINAKNKKGFGLITCLFKKECKC
jgi:hypothetical protein